MHTCKECGSRFQSDGTPLWGMCPTCHEAPRTLRVNVGPQPHLMSEKERYMHIKHRNELEKGRREGTKEVTEKGPVEFRPRHDKSVY